MQDCHFVSVHVSVTLLHMFSLSYKVWLEQQNWAYGVQWICDLCIQSMLHGVSLSCDTCEPVPMEPG